MIVSRMCFLFNAWCRVSILLISMCFLWKASTFAQYSTRKKHVYVNLSVGVDRLSLRDKATSPLIYSGTIPSFRLSAHSQKVEKRYFQAALQYAFGSMKNQVGTEFSQSFIHALWFQAQQMYAVSLHRKSQIYFGGTLDLTNNIRVNSKLMNNSLGLDFIQSLFATAEYRYFLQPVQDKVYNFYLFKIKNSAQQRKYFAFKLYLPVWMSTYRNGYAYANQSGVVNGLGVLDGFEYKIWNGVRLMSQMSFNKELKNGNRYQLSYVWDAYKVDYHQSLTVAHHNVQFSLWYNLK